MLAFEESDDFFLRGSLVGKGGIEGLFGGING